MRKNRGARELEQVLAYRWPWGRPWLVALGIALVASPIAGAAALYQTVTTESPARGDAAVVAQGVVSIPADDLVWEVSAESAPPPANAVANDAVNGFLIVTTGTVLVENLESDAQARIAAGEAALTVAGDAELRAAAGATAASYRQLRLVPVSLAGAAETSLFASQPFAGLDGNHDLDLVKDVMAAGETTVVGAGEGPTLVSVLGGAVDVTTGAGEVVSLATDQSAALAGELTLTAGAEGAIVVAAVIGPAVPGLATGEAAATTAPAATPVVQAPAASPIAEPPVANETPVAAITPDTAAADTTSETAEPVATTVAPASDIDSDGDGLTDAAEAEINSDPASTDTDGDGLTDGDESLVYGTAVLAPDSDGDGVLDGDEIAQGTDPIAAPSGPVPAAATEGDSDGDGMPDNLEFEIGTDAFDADTDDDGLLDGDEYYVYQTGTLNPDNDGDGVLDGAEIENGTDPNDPGSF